MLHYAVAILVTVSSVTDGDTFRTTNGDRVRLWGIDAPEITTTEGIYAKQALRDIIIADGPQLTCYVMDKDNYGRTVARCDTPTHQDLGCLMILRGHAIEWPYFSHGYYKQRNCA
jgi:endonuclease YncB( thermonuclease family)